MKKLILICAIDPFIGCDNFIFKHKSNEYASIQLEEIATGHILIFGQINEVDGTFVLDTGSGGTVIDEKNKNKFKLTTNDTEEKASGVGGSNIEMLTSENNHLKIGDLELTDQSFILMNLDYVNDAFELNGLERVDGIIGTHILKNNKAIIDYSTLKIYLKNNLIANELNKYKTTASFRGRQQDKILISNASSEKHKPTTIL